MGPGGGVVPLALSHANNDMGSVARPPPDIFSTGPIPAPVVPPLRPSLRFAIIPNILRTERRLALRNLVEQPAWTRTPLSNSISSFEAMVQTRADTGTEFWLARDLQMLLGYAQWRKFESVIHRAITACQTSGHDPGDHFACISKMVDVGSAAKREIDDIALTRYACYLIAQNGDPAKEQIAFAQTYFAVQTRQQEIIQTRLAKAERSNARQKLTRSEKELSGIIFDRLRSNESFARPLHAPTPPHPALLRANPPAHLTI